MMLSFGIVFFVVARYGFPVIVHMVEERKKYIDQSLLKADEANKLLADVQQKKEAMLDEARNEQLSILRETTKNKEAILAEAKEAARKETQKMLEEARKQMILERETAMAEMRSQVAVLAVDIAEKVLRSELKDREPQLELVDRLLGEVKKDRAES